MADLARIKRNVAKMVSMGAPESDIDGYISSEGVTVEDVRNYNPNLKPLTPEQRAKSKIDPLSGVAYEALTGTLEGIGLGIESGLQGASLGLYGRINQALGGNYAEREAENQARAEREGLGTLNTVGKALPALYGAVKGAPMKIYQGVTATGLGGLGAGITAGGIEGAIAKAAQAQNASDVIPYAVSGGVEGAAFGAGGELLGRGLAGLYNYLRPQATAAKESIRKLRDLVGGEELTNIAQEARRTGRSALEVGDSNVIDSAIKSKFNSSKAKKTLTDVAERLSSQQSERNINAINQAFGSRGGVQNADELIATTKQQAQPLYDDLSRVGSVKDPRIDNLLKDDFIQQEIKSINADKANELAIRQAPDNDFRKLDLVKRSIDDKISSAKRAGENNRARLLEQRRNDLVTTLDDIYPQYKEARGVYENQYRILDAQELGNKALNPNVTVDTFRKYFSRLSEGEKQAARIGARDKIVNDVLGKENQSVAWKKYTNQNAKDKLDLLLGQDTADSLVNYANGEIKTMRNINQVLGGSQTAEKTAGTSIQDVGLKLLRDPLGAAGTIAEQATNPATRAQAEYLSKVLTESGANTLNEELIKQVQRDEISKLLGALNVYGSTSLGLKLTE